MMKAKVVAAAMAAFLLAWLTDTARADFTLTGNQHLTVDTSHGLGELYGQSKAWVVTDGWVGWLVADDDSTVGISDGSVGYLYAYGRSSAAMSGGGVAYLYAYDSTTVSISGGAAGILYAGNSSIVDMSGGSMGCLATYGTSAVAMSGGSALALQANQTSSLAMSGGSGDVLIAYDTSTVTFHGYDFQAMEGLSLAGDIVLGTGVLTGKWLDGTAWSISITDHAPTATIKVIAEPSAWGDADCDGVVGAADYIALKRNFGTCTNATWQQGDFDWDRHVNWNDLQVLMGNFGAGSEPAPVTMPEPATLATLVLGGLAVPRRRRK